MEFLQVLMTVSDFFLFGYRNHFLEGGFTFEWGASFLSGGGPWGASASIGEVQKNNGMRGAPPIPLPSLGNPAFTQRNYMQAIFFIQL